MGKYIAGLLVFCLLWAIVFSLADRPSLPTEDFYTFKGTTTALLPVGDDVYMTVVSRTGKYVARSGDCTDILKISRKDFLAKRSAFERVARVEGRIPVAALSHDGTTLYFFQRQQAEPGGPEKEFFCGFDLKTGVISRISEKRVAVGSRLVDVDGKYLLLYGGMYAEASLDGGGTWHKLPGDKSTGLFARTTVADGALYLARGDELLVMPGEAITAGTFQEEKLRDLEPGMAVYSLLAGEGHLIHLSGSMGKAGEDPYRDDLKRPFLISLDGNSAAPLSALWFDKSYRWAKPLFAHGKGIYCSGYSATYFDEFRLLKITGDTIRRSRAFEESPDLLGTLGDYLIFTVDAVWQRKSFLFGIKYT